MHGMHRHRVKRSFQRRSQILAAVLFNGYLLGFQKGRIFTGASKAVCVPVLNCYSCPGALGACPVGSLQSALGSGFPFYTVGLLMVFGILLGRLVCGLLCPFGLVQDLLHKIPLPKWKLPEKPDRAARYLKYAVLLLLVLLLPALSAGRTGCPSPGSASISVPPERWRGGFPCC